MIFTVLIRLTKFISLRNTYVRTAGAGNVNGMEGVATMSFISINNEPSVVLVCTVSDSDDTAEVYTLTHNDSKTQYSVCEKPSDEQTKGISGLLDDFSDTLSNIPGCADTLSHEIKLKTTDVIYRRN